MAFCTLPLYGLSALQTELPWIVEDWLQYHLEYLGIQHAQIYDIDGSFEQALENWTRWSDHRRGFVTYQKEWPKTLSDALTRMSRDHPCCTEIFAYAHCTTTQRALSRWVLLLHSPDEYVVFSKNRKTLKALPSFIEEFVERGGWDRQYLLHELALALMKLLCKEEQFCRLPCSEATNSTIIQGSLIQNTVPAWDHTYATYHFEFKSHFF